MPVTTAPAVLAAIDVGTNAVRLELARPNRDGSLETLHQERDPVRPGEGVFKTGYISAEVADRLMSTLRRYSALCRRYQAKVRAVATSALRDAKNRTEVVRRAREEAGLSLEVVSGREEARLICLGVLHGKPAGSRSLCIDIGGGSTEVAFAEGEGPKNLWSVALGAVRLTELFDAAKKISPRQLKLMRRYAADIIGEAIPQRIAGAPNLALGSSGTINAIVGFAAAEGTAHVTRKQLTKAVEELAELGPGGRRKRFDPRRADIVVSGAVVLEALVEHLRLKSVIAVNRGLRDGILVDLLRKQNPNEADSSLTLAALEVGRRFGFDEKHARQVMRLSLALFDDLARLHALPAAARPYLAVASLLHDIGNTVSYERHHKHTYYLIQHADIPGLADHERELVALVARYHRRSHPDLGHSALKDVSKGDAALVRKLATLLRVADSLDRSHQQPVKNLHAEVKGSNIQVHFTSNRPVDLELWDVSREEPLFRRVFGARLDLDPTVRG